MRLSTRLVALALVASLTAAAATFDAGVAGASRATLGRHRAAIPHDVVQTRTGSLPDGATWKIEVPKHWNGTVLLYQHGLVPPGEPNPATDASDPVSARFLLDHGYALAGSSFASTGWAVEQALRDQVDLLDVFTAVIGKPRTTISWGDSMGGLLAAALAEQSPGRIDGALSMCGPLAGGVRLMDTYLDVLFTIKTLLAPSAPIELARIQDPFTSVQLIVDALGKAQQTPQGRARIALAAAVGDIPGWVDPDEPEPARRDVATQEANQFSVLRDVTAVLGVLLRTEIEGRAGGNPSTNVGVDYGRQLQRSSSRSEVRRLYRQAGLNLHHDLHELADAPRIAADPSARDYLDRFVTPDGHLHGVPVLTMHTIGDPLAAVEHEDAYATSVWRAGDQGLLRQAFLNRAGHCAFTPAEKVAALQTLAGRVQTGSWHHTATPRSLNARAHALGPDLNVHVDDDGQIFPTDPAFTRFRPGRFPR